MIVLPSHDNFTRQTGIDQADYGEHLPLFAGSEAAAHRTAISCSLVQTCEHFQINPFVYLGDVIERVSTHLARLVSELTPREWKRLGQDSRAQAAA